MTNDHPHRIDWFEVPVVQPATANGPFGTVAQIEDGGGNVVGLHAPR
jgi:predicted enzyme related to lactoylglutathione lyase